MIKQITYLLFLRRLDELQTLAENKANRTGRPLERVIFEGGATDPRRWQNFKQAAPASMFGTVAEQVFPFLRTLGGAVDLLDAHEGRGDSLSDGASGDAELYSLILANPPFAGSLDYESTAKDLQRMVKTKKTELLFPALFLRLLQTGGRAAVIVPDGVLFGSSKAHRELRRTLVEDHKLDGVVKLPGGVFKPYAGVSTAILLFTKTGVGGTDHVWFYEVTADGWSLDDKRTPLLADERLGPRPAVALTADEHANNSLPDALTRWRSRDGEEHSRCRTEQSFCVPKADIAAQGYDLSLNRYKEVVHEDVQHRPPLEIIADLERLEGEIQLGLSDLKAMI